MKKYIIEALNQTFNLLPTPPTHKVKIVSECLFDTSVAGIIVAYNNIPDDIDKKDAYIHTEEYVSDATLYISWETQVLTTDKDKDIFTSKYFSRKVYKSVYDLLTSNGYKRVGYSTALLKPFDDTTVYKLFMEKDFDRLVAYYSFQFKKDT